MNESVFYVLQLIQSQQLPFDRWDVLESCQSTKQMFGTNLDFTLEGKWMILYFDTNKEALELFNDNILPAPTMVLKTRYGAETCIYFYPCDDDACHRLSKENF